MLFNRFISFELSIQMFGKVLFQEDTLHQPTLGQVPNLGPFDVSFQFFFSPNFRFKFVERMFQ
jgi:hypothetical protein